MQQIFNGKRALQVWRRAVQWQLARETDLNNLLEYYNKDVALAHSRLYSALLQWADVAAEVYA